MDELRKYRKGLDAVAAALLEHETVDGAEVKRLVDEAFGDEVHVYPESEQVPQFAETAASSDGTSDGEALRRHPDDTRVLER